MRDGWPGHRHDRAVLDARTELTAATAPDLRRGLYALARPGRTVDLRLDDVTVFDMSGLGLLVGLHRRADREDVQLVCVNPPGDLLAAMNRIGLQRVLRVEHR